MEWVTPNLNSLPREILLEIISFLDPIRLKKFAVLAKKFYWLINENPQLILIKIPFLMEEISFRISVKNQSILFNSIDEIIKTKDNNFISILSKLKDNGKLKTMSACRLNSVLAKIQLRNNAIAELNQLENNKQQFKDKCTTIGLVSVVVPILLGKVLLPILWGDRLDVLVIAIFAVIGIFVSQFLGDYLYRYERELEVKRITYSNQWSNLFYSAKTLLEPETQGRSLSIRN